MTVTTVRSKRKPRTEIEAQTGFVPAHWVRVLLTPKEMVAFAIVPELPKAIVSAEARGAAGKGVRAPVAVLAGSGCCL